MAARLAIIGWWHSCERRPALVEITPQRVVDDPHHVRVGGCVRVAMHGALLSSRARQDARQRLRHPASGTGRATSRTPRPAAGRSRGSRSPRRRRARRRSGGRPRMSSRPASTSRALAFAGRSQDLGELLVRRRRLADELRERCRPFVDGGDERRGRRDAIGPPAPTHGEELRPLGDRDRFVVADHRVVDDRVEQLPLRRVVRVERLDGDAGVTSDVAHPGVGPALRREQLGGGARGASPSSPRPASPAAARRTDVAGMRRGLGSWPHLRTAPYSVQACSDDSVCRQLTR